MMLFAASPNALMADLSRIYRAERRQRDTWHERCSAPGYTFLTRRIVMLYWAAVFFVIALLAAVFGFGGLAASAAGVAKILFFVFLVFALVSFLFGRRSPTA